MSELRHSRQAVLMFGERSVAETLARVSSNPRSIRGSMGFSNEPGA